MLKFRLIDSHLLQGRWLASAMLAFATSAAAGSGLIFMNVAEAVEAGGGRGVPAGREAVRADSSGARLSGEAGRNERMLELRRQLLEHSRQWRGAAGGPQSQQSLPTQGIRQVSRSPATPQPSSLAGGIMSAGALQLSPDAPGDAGIGVSPAQSGNDARLSERERSQLRQQLLQNARSLGRER